MHLLETNGTAVNQTGYNELSRGNVACLPALGKDEVEERGLQ